MTSAWAARVYEHDKRTAIVCRDMQIVGFRFDRERAAELASHLHGLEVAALDRISRAAGYQINPLSPNQLQWAFFDQLRAPVYFRSSLTGRPSLGVDAMRGYAACAREGLRELALAILEYRRARKLRRTYVEGVHVGPDGRVHPTWLNYGTVSGRFSCQNPNVMNLPHPTRDPTTHLGGVRALYCASPGHRLVYFDWGQLEMRIAAYASGDPVMIAACEGSDLHAGNAKACFGEAFDMVAYMAGKEAGNVRADLQFMRQVAKSAGFAVCYGANASTVHARMVADGMTIRLQEVEAMLRTMRGSFRQYYRWQDQRLHETIRTGYVESPLLGRRRYVGHDPDATMVMNFPIQSGAADVENSKLMQILDRLEGLGLGRTCPLVAQVHDSNCFDVPERHVDTVCEVIRSVCSEPVRFGDRSAVLPIDLEVLERWH